MISNLVETYLKDSPDYLIDVAITPGNIITIEIDNDNGVGIDECEALSMYLESQLDRDVEDFELTVSSAGLTSPFKTIRQYKKYLGKEIETLTKKGEKLKGILKEANESGFTLTTAKKVKPEGGKRKIEVSEDIHLSYEETKYTKYLISFK
jgi:ribosome maturation factor RimP